MASRRRINHVVYVRQVWKKYKIMTFHSNSPMVTLEKVKSIAQGYLQTPTAKLKNCGSDVVYI